ncbi:MAG TPA: insulinase family protein, partial [Bacteroidales bacterium]|nr:insulinase family protein [Bacteroidales bacterium]
MKINRLVIIIVLLVFIPAFSQVVILGQIRDPDSPIPPDSSVIIGRLDNGLAYYIKHNKKPEQRMEMRLAVNAGSICETDDQQGLAHFVEHMCFNGTKNFPSNRIVDMLEEMGMKFGEEINAYTSFDETVYMLKVPTDKTETINAGFRILEDWAHQVSMEEEEIDKERGVIVEEWRLGLGADERMMQKYIPVLLKGSRYAERLPIGRMDIVKSCPYDTLRAFYRTWYRPDLMAVVIVGDIDTKLAEDKIIEHFGRIPRSVNARPRIEYSVPGNDEPLISVVTDREAPGFDIQIMFKQAKARSVTYNDYRRSQMRSLFSSMFNARLRELTRKPDAPFLYAGSGYGSFIGRSMDVYSIYASSKENQLKESIEVILAENEKVRRYGFNDSELEREKKNILSFYEQVAKEADKTESATYASEFIRNYISGESIPGYQKEYELVREFLPGIGVEEINSMGREWISDRNIIALLTAQEKEGLSIPSEEEISEMIKSAESRELEAYVDSEADAPLLAEMPSPSPVVRRTENKNFRFTELSFGNGVRMILMPTDFKNDEILLSAYSPGGISLYPDNEIMSATLAATVVTQSGLGDYDLTGLQKLLSGNTAKLTPYISELLEGFSGSCSPKDLETLLQLNYLYFTGVRRDDDAYSSYMSRMKNMIGPMRAIPRVKFADTLSKVITRNSPRVINLPTDAQLDQADLGRIMSIFRERFASAGDFTYIMVGNFDVNEVLPLLEKYIGGLPSVNGKEKWRDMTPGFPEGLVEIEVAENSEPQSLVAMVWKGDFKWKPVERMGFSMLMEILSIKCRESMREDQGGVYGVSVSGTVSKNP